MCQELQKTVCAGAHIEGEKRCVWEGFQRCSIGDVVPETNRVLALENRPFAPEGKDSLPTIHFPVLC